MANFILKKSTITISNLRLRAIIGFNAWEREEKQDVVVSISMDIDPGKALLSDSISDTLNYKQVKKTILAVVENSSFNLLESLAYEILGAIMGNKEVVSSRITVDKPHALRFADSVSVGMCAERRPEPVS